MILNLRLQNEEELLNNSVAIPFLKMSLLLEIVVTCLSETNDNTDGDRTKALLYTSQMRKLAQMGKS
jgi:hypothetical protein